MTCIWDGPRSTCQRHKMDQIKNLGRNFIRLSKSSSSGRSLLPNRDHCSCRTLGVRPQRRTPYSVRREGNKYSFLCGHCLLRLRKRRGPDGKSCTRRPHQPMLMLCISNRSFVRCAGFCCSNKGLELLKDPVERRARGVVCRPAAARRGHEGPRPLRPHGRESPRVVGRAKPCARAAPRSLSQPEEQNVVAAYVVPPRITSTN